MTRRSLRILAALIVVASAALPFYTCTSYVDESGNSVEVEPGAALPPGVRAEVEVHRPIERFDLLDSDSYFLMLAFLWPLAFVGIRAALRHPGGLRAILIAEPLLLLGSGWIFHAQSSVGERAWGAAVALRASAAVRGASVGGFAAWARHDRARRLRRRIQLAPPCSALSAPPQCGQQEGVGRTSRAIVASSRWSPRSR
jgi:hypothetical protein